MKVWALYLVGERGPLSTVQHQPPVRGRRIVRIDAATYEEKDRQHQTPCDEMGATTIESLPSLGRARCGATAVSENQWNFPFVSHGVC